MGQTCTVTVRDSAMIYLELGSDPAAIPLFWSRQRSHPLLIFIFSFQSSVEFMLMIISMILIIKTYLDLQKLPGLGKGKACNLVPCPPKPGLALQLMQDKVFNQQCCAPGAWLLQEKASNPHHWPKPQQWWLSHQIRGKGKTSGFLTTLLEPFVLWQVPDHCCFPGVWIHPERKRFIVGPR